MVQLDLILSIRRERTKKVIKDIKEAVVLTDDDASVLEIVLGILLVNSFEISIYDREQEIRSSTDSSIQGSLMKFQSSGQFENFYLVM